MHWIGPTCPPQGWLSLWVMPQGTVAVLQGDPHGGWSGAPCQGLGRVGGHPPSSASSIM